MTGSVLMSVFFGTSLILGQTTRSIALIVLSYLSLHGTKPAERKAILTALGPVIANWPRAGNPHATTRQNHPGAIAGNQAHVQSGSPNGDPAHDCRCPSPMKRLS